MLNQRCLFVWVSTQHGRKTGHSGSRRFKSRAPNNSRAGQDIAAEQAKAVSQHFAKCSQSSVDGCAKKKKLCVWSMVRDFEKLLAKRASARNHIPNADYSTTLNSDITELICHS